MRCEQGGFQEVEQNIGGDREARDREKRDPAESHIGVAAVRGSFRARTRRRHRSDHAAHDGACEFQQCPDGGDADGTCADETHVMGPHIHCACADICSICRLHGSKNGNRGGPCDQEAQQHRHADGNAHEVTRAHQCQREGHVVAADGIAAEPEEARDFAGHDLRGGEGGQRRGRDRTVHDGEQPFAGFAFGPVGNRFARARTHFEHFGRRDAFGIGKVRCRHHRAAQGNCEQHAENSACRTNEKCRPKRKARPGAHDDEARQHEDDGRERACRRRHRLHDVVLEDRGALERRKHRHRDHGCGNRGGEGQPHLQSEIDVGGREDRGDRYAEDDTPNRQLDDPSLLSCRHACPLANPGDTLTECAADAKKAEDKKRGRAEALPQSTSQLPLKTSARKRGSIMYDLRIVADRRRVDRNIAVDVVDGRITVAGYSRLFVCRL